MPQQKHENACHTLHVFCIIEENKYTIRMRFVHILRLQEAVYRTLEDITTDRDGRLCKRTLGLGNSVKGYKPTQLVKPNERPDPKSRGIN